MATGVAVASLATAVVGTAMGIREQRQARKAQEEAQDVQQSQAAVQDRRARQQAVERARRRRAAVVAQSQARGAMRSSPVQGALGSFESDVGANMAFQRQLQGLDQQRSDALGRVSRAQGRSRTFQAIGQVPGQLGFGPAQAGAHLRRTFSNQGGASVPGGQGPNMFSTPHN